MDTVLQRSVSALDEFTASDNEQRERVVARRQSWATTARAMIVDTLNQIVKAMGSHERGLYVHQARLYDNFESVQIAFGSIPTGILQRTAGGGGALGVERGATLVFGQSEGGKIAVVRYPFFTELPSKQDSRRETYEYVGAFEPEDITREFVLNQAKDFFEWVGGTSYRRPAPAEGHRNPMGFLPPRVEVAEAPNGTKA